MLASCTYKMPQFLNLRLKAFGVHLIGIKRYNPKGAMRKLGMDWVGGIEDLKELLSRSDFVILCLPMTPESRNLIDYSAFSSQRGIPAKI